MKHIIKRDGRRVKFSPEKIQNALIKAMLATRNNTVEDNQLEAMALTQKIVSKCYSRFTDIDPTVEQVQDVVVETLIESGIVDVSKAYILYREERNQHRDAQSALMQKIEEITFSDSKESDLKRDNANVDGNTSMGTMLQYGSAVSKQFAKDRLLNKEFAEEFSKGNIYPHDLDFMPMGTTTCVSGHTELTILQENGEVVRKRINIFDNLFGLSNNEDAEVVYPKGLTVMGKNGWTRVKNISRRMLGAHEKYYRIKTMSGHGLFITGEHKIPVVRDGKETLIRMKDLQVGDFMLYNDKTSTQNKKSVKRTLNRVMGIEEVNVREYVYDLETKEHWFLANNLVVHNCLQINLDKLYKNGFDTGHGALREPQSIASYASLAAITMQANQNDQHGGQSIPLFDYYMAPGVTKSYIKNIKEYLEIMMEYANVEALLAEDILAEILDKRIDLFKIENKNSLKQTLSGKLLEMTALNISEAMRIANKTITKAIDKTDKQTYQAMEGFVHNLNTLHSRAGSQVPFSSVNFGMDTSEEGRMVTKNLLLAQEAGLGNGETPIFPILIFQVKEGVNYNPEDPNYDLYKLAMRVSAKRLFPNFVFVDAPFNLQYYKPEDPETIISTMGCVDGEEVVTYKWDGKLFVESFSRFWEKVECEYPVDTEGESEYFDLEALDADIKIYDSMSKDFVKCRKLIRNPDQSNWVKLIFSSGRELLATDDHPLPIVGKGRTFVKDIKVGDQVHIVNTQYSEEKAKVNLQDAWLLGVILRNASYRKTTRISLSGDSVDIVEQVKEALKRKSAKDIEVKQLDKKEGVHYEISVCDEDLSGQLFQLFEGVDKLERIVPTIIYSLSKESKLAFVAGIIDSHGELYLEDNCARVRFSTANKELALQEMLLLQSVDIHAQYYQHKFTKNKKAYHVEFPMTEELYEYLVSETKKDKIEFVSYKRNPAVIEVKEIQYMGYRNQMSYDVETESDYFDVSGILSHNCRTRVIGNVNGKETPVGRGNLSFTTINLPRLGIEYGLKYRQNGGNGWDKDGFFAELDKMMELATKQLLERLEIQKRKKVKNFPFLMGQGNWTGSENLNPNDELGDILDSGTLSIGFIGLAECLKALIGVHHGENEEAQKLGLEIIGHMREKTDKAIQDYHLNFSLLATPAEGLSGYFTRIDKKRYGVIAGITDRNYYTNSFHVPVYYKISAFDKIKKEAPYHALTNAGHISYIEMDGDPSNNIEAFEAVVRCMKESGIGYGSINHPVDRDPICGYSGIITGHICPKCGRSDIEHREYKDTFKRIKL